MSVILIDVVFSSVPEYGVRFFNFPDSVKI